METDTVNWKEKKVRRQKYYKGNNNKFLRESGTESFSYKFFLLPGRKEQQ